MSSAASVTPIVSSAPSAEQISAEHIAAEIERFVRASFDVPDDDPGFGRDVDLFADGYVDSVGVVEVVSFLEFRYHVTLPEDALFDPSFNHIRGMAEIVTALLRG